MQRLLLIVFCLLLHACFSSSQDLLYSRYSDCAPVSYICGDANFTIGYPFRIDSRPDYCGYPNFYLSCTSNSTLTISITNKNYRVTSIDYENGLLNLVNPAFVHRSCLQSYSNTSVDPDLFRVSNRDTNVTIFINCTATSSSVPYVYHMMCSVTGTGGHSYYRLIHNGTMDDVLGRCSSMVTVPMAQDAATRMANGELGFGAALQQGFNLNWSPGDGWCSGCVSSGGVCGYNSTSPTDPTCFCPDGRFLDSCYAIISRGRKGSPKVWTIFGTWLGVTLMVSCCAFITFWYHSHEGQKKDARIIDASLEKHGPPALRSYSYPDVKRMTKSFRKKLGRGGYGTVFKGELPDGHAVAVKVLTESRGDGKDFVNEIATIGRTSHVNVVTLRGFCAQGSKRALVYDFMPNGSLEKYICSENSEAGIALGWEKLYEIAVGIARGLEYLHRGCNTRIVHFDIKPHNILLDQDFCPKISDFGMAKLCRRKGSIVSMEGMRGTIGYIAPEVFSRTFGAVSSKSDVYSYGMLLLDMFGDRRKKSNKLDSTSDDYFPQWIYRHLDQDDDLEAYGVTGETIEIVRKIMMVGFWCIQTMPENRPTISRVVDMLEGSLTSLSMPPKPCLSSPFDLIHRNEISDPSGITESEPQYGRMVSLFQMSQKKASLVLLNG